MMNHGKPSAQFFVRSDGNHRVIQPVNTQDPVQISDDPSEFGMETEDFTTRFVLVLVFTIICQFILLGSCCLFVKEQMARKIENEDLDPAE